MGKKYCWKIREKKIKTSYWDGDEIEYIKTQQFGIKYHFLFLSWFFPKYSEIVPQWSVYQNNCLGFTDFKSEIPEWCFKINCKV